MRCFLNALSGKNDSESQAEKDDGKTRLFNDEEPMVSSCRLRELTARGFRGIHAIVNDRFREVKIVISAKRQADIQKYHQAQHDDKHYSSDLHAFSPSNATQLTCSERERAWLAG